ncbi:hypothetical protein EYW49_03295 [Siculibacillus lacustris]|uniref:Tetratricopeptide repeat protein n=1 Tax=Siculibacillus lacustris TaxID=1549641 RepID=A0A4Q9VWZ6_9HYPH|nr:hypothetical protein [Siculibacillus lacustris]TBW40763.1 hypothetical protein EYW49_03295 [Siculibacillus lacustris]
MSDSETLDPVDRHAAALAALEGARAARTDPVAAEAAVAAALALAPDSWEVRTGAYKFYFYDHRLAEAVPHAAFCIAAAARALGLDEDWRRIAPRSAAFDGFDAEPRRLLHALVAWGYCRIRTGDFEGGAAALAKVAELDPADRLGAARLIAVVERGGREDPD